MKCPECGAAGAYVGLKAVECQSKTCRHYVPPAGAAQPKKSGDCGHGTWVKLAVIDLSFREQCSTCGRTRRKTVLSQMSGTDHWYYD